jgi:hypothetical protein
MKEAEMSPTACERLRRVAVGWLIDVLVVSWIIVRVNPPSYALQPRSDTAVGAHCGRAEPRSRSRLVAAVGEGG